MSDDMIRRIGETLPYIPYFWVWAVLGIILGIIWILVGQ